MNDQRSVSGRPCSLRMFITRDKDLGGLVFVERLGKGVE